MRTQRSLISSTTLRRLVGQRRSGRVLEAATSGIKIPWTADNHRTMVAISFTLRQKMNDFGFVVFPISRIWFLSPIAYEFTSHSVPLAAVVRP